ncbi:MAG: hypothetical protein H0X47_14220 [Nitrospirales bacterium]|nr:hypothetical protein [Nitrospirales bacterium]
MKTRSTGPDSKIAVSEVRYDNRGAVTQQSLPMFEPATPTQWTTLLYDPLSRTIRATNPNVSRGLSCGDDWVSLNGVGDTNGDTKTDLVWRHTDGSVSVWLMRCTSVQQTGQPGVARMEWAIKGVGMAMAMAMERRFTMAEYHRGPHNPHNLCMVDEWDQHPECQRPRRLVGARPHHEHDCL